MALWKRHVHKIKVHHFASTGYKDLPSMVLAFLVTMILVALGLKRYMYKKHVEVPEDRDPVLRNARGQACWNYLFVALYIGFCWGVFLFTIALVAVVNEDVMKNPIISNTEYRADRSKTPGTLSQEFAEQSQEYQERYPIESAGLRAFEVGVGEILSIAVASITVLNWRYYGQVKITTSLLMQFMLRGASLSFCFAIIPELVGMRVIALAGLPFAIDKLLSMILVGFSEELAKVIALTRGALLTPEAVRQASAKPKTCLTCCQCFRALSETPRALALAGLAAGFGFMTAENVEYLVASASKPTTVPVGLEEGKSDEEVSMIQAIMSGVITLVTAGLVAIRVLLNCHPWWTGVSAIYVARIAFESGTNSADLSFKQLLRCTWPSAVIHAAFDFSVTVLPLLSFVCIPLSWFISRRFFYKLWLDAVDVPGAMPHVPSTRSPIEMAVQSHDVLSNFMREEGARQNAQHFRSCPSATTSAQ